jgi:hypothetical protein
LLIAVIEIIDALKANDQWTSAQSAGPTDAPIAATDKTSDEKPALIAHLAQTVPRAPIERRVPTMERGQIVHHVQIAVQTDAMTARPSVNKPAALKTGKTGAPTAALIAGKLIAKRTAKSAATAKDVATIRAIAKPIATRDSQTAAIATITATRTVVM